MSASRDQDKLNKLLKIEGYAWGKSQLPCSGATTLCRRKSNQRGAPAAHSR